MAALRLLNPSAELAIARRPIALERPLVGGIVRMRSVLVVEDQQDKMRKILDGLKALQFGSIRTAVTLKEALGTIQKLPEPLSILITDIVFPETAKGGTIVKRNGNYYAPLSGLAVIETAKAKFPEMPVLVQSSASPECLAIAYEMGADYVLPKSELARLEEVVRMLL